MTSKLGNVLHGIKDLAKYEAKEIKDGLKHKDAPKGSPEAGNVLKEIGDAFVDFGGAAIGFGEMGGLKYPVTQYEFKVSPELTRGSRLDGSQMDSLAKQGFHGVVNLCAENDNDAAPAGKAGLNALHLPIIDNTPPTAGQMKQFLDFATDPKNQPCYVHCEAGKGRTGVATACYRMAVEGWSSDQAIAEAKKFGMAMPDQAEFIERFGQDLAAGRIDGYPKK